MKFKRKIFLATCTVKLFTNYKQWGFITNDNVVDVLKYDKRFFYCNKLIAVKKGYNKVLLVAPVK